MPAIGPDRSLDRIVLGAVWLASALYVAACLKRGWVPWDAGMLGQTAERVLQGQVPFRDFIEPYTGGLTYLNALAFRLFGVNLFSPRVPLLIFFLGWVPAVYLVARRFAAPLAAGLATLLAIAWSVPNYPEAMPSWYNLFFATWGTLALLCYIETEKRRWLWLAGLCGGLSIAVKITGLYFVGAGLLFFAFREQSLCSRSAARPSRRALLYRAFLVVCLGLFLILLLETVWERPGLATVVHFVLPGTCLVALLLWRESQQSPGADRTRFRTLLSMALPLLAGALMPITALLLWYAHAGALRGFLETTFLMNMRRMQWIGSDPVSPLLVLALAPAVLIFFPSRLSNDSIPHPATRAAPVLFFAILLLACWKSWTVFEVMGLSLSLIVPLIALAALVWLRPCAPAPEINTASVLLAVTVAVLCALTQFPFARPIYFNSVAPLEILAVLALTSPRRRTPKERWARGALATFYLVFALWLGTPAYFDLNFPGAQRGSGIRTLPSVRAGGIRVAAEQERAYARLIPLVQDHARGAFIYAAPDCPEVYFLSGFHNPTPTLYDFLDSDFFDIPARTERILGTIREGAVHAVVLRVHPAHSGPLPAGLRAALDAQFPQSALVGDFEVRWKP